MQLLRITVQWSYIFSSINGTLCSNSLMIAVAIWGYLVETNIIYKFPSSWEIHYQ